MEAPVIPHSPDVWQPRLLASFPIRSVIAVLDGVAAIYGYPKYLRVDNGTELTSKLMQLWAEEHGVELLFIQPGKPTQHAYIESFNSRVCSELLNAHWFHNLPQARMHGSAHSHRNHWPHDGAELMTSTACWFPSRNA